MHFESWCGYTGEVRIKFQQLRDHRVELVDQFVKGGKTIEFQPEGLVFSEAPSKLVDANNKPITHF